MNKYIVVTNSSLDGLVTTVSSLIDRGYVPCGGIAVQESTWFVYIQAMVLK